MMMNPILTFFKRHRWCIAIVLPLVIFFTIEMGISAGQLLRWKENIKPYHVTFFLRPVVKKFVKDDFYPRTQNMQSLPWDYATDRMRPGRYTQAEGLPDYTINSFGIRGPEFQHPKPKGTYRIVVFGGSSTFSGTSDDEHTYPYLLQQHLNAADSGKKFEVLNYGVGSKSLYYNAKKYFSEVDYLEPDMIIINNIRNTWYYDPNQEISNYDDILISEEYWQRALSHWLTDHLLIYRLYKNQRTKSRNLSYASLSRAQGVSFNRVFFDKLYSNLLRSIYYDTKKRQISLILAFEPIFYDAAKQRQIKSMDNRELYQLLKTIPGSDTISQSIIFSTILYNNIHKLNQEFSDIIVADDIEHFLQLEESGPGKYFSDSYHLSPRGNEIFAKFLSDKILNVIKGDFR